MGQRKETRFGGVESGLDYTIRAQGEGKKKKVDSRDPFDIGWFGFGVLYVLDKITDFPGRVLGGVKDLYHLLRGDCSTRGLDSY